MFLCIYKIFLGAPREGGWGVGCKLPSICASWNGRIFERPSYRLRIWKVELWDGHLLLTFVGVYHELFMESGMMIFFPKSWYVTHEQSEF